MKILVETIKKGKGAADYSAAPVSTSFFQVCNPTSYIDAERTDLLSIFIEKRPEQKHANFFHRHLIRFPRQVHIDKYVAIFDHDKVESAEKVLAAQPRIGCGWGGENNRVGESIFQAFHGILQEQVMLI